MYVYIDLMYIVKFCFFVNYYNYEFFYICILYDNCNFNNNIFLMKFIMCKLFFLMNKKLDYCK